jgi:D-alanine--D-alanine ligase
MLLFGGQSAEHDVSRVTAVAVARALDPAKYDVVPVGITTEGRWVLASEAQIMLAAGRDELPAAFAVEGDVVPVPSASRAVVATGADESMDVDVVIPLLHGPYGEDGTVQGLLELAGLPYVGAGVLASAVAMDKIAMKQLFAAAGLETARGLPLREGHDVDEYVERVEAELGYPCFVKPVNMGSSIGVSKARSRAELRAAIEHALTFDEWILTEEMIAGREIEVGVLGDDPPRASLPGEIVPAADFYDYADKYEDGKAELRAPAPLSPEQTERVQQLAVRAFEALRGEAMARVDFFLRDGGDFVVNEVNTIPGFTPISPRLWEISGVPYAELLDRLIEFALARAGRRADRRGRQR